MKKLLSLFLSVIMIMSALPVIAGAEATLTNVALNRPGFSKTYYGTYHPQYATDENIKTSYMYHLGGWYYVDLGAKYEVDSVDLLLGERNTNYKVYLSNTRPTIETPTISEAAVLEVGTTAATTDASGYTNIAISDDTKYQFVIVQHTKGLEILDIKVMTPDADSNFYMVEVGAYKPTFAASTDGEAYPYKANDRDIDTVYLAEDVIWTEGVTNDPLVEQSLIIDLGTAMPLHAVTYHPTNHNLGGGNYEHWRSQNVSIYVTNNPNDLTDAVVKGENMKYLSNYIELPDAIKGNSYRYVVINGGKVQKYQSSPAEWHRSLTIVDLGIYSDSTAAQQTYSFNTNDRTHLISYGADAKANADTWSGNNTYKHLADPNNITDGDLTTEWDLWKNATALAEGYIMIDLGKPQTIDYLTAMSGDGYTTDDVSRSAEIFVSNTADFTTTGATVMHTEGENGMQPQNRMRLYTASSAMNGNKYRYVGMRIPATSGRVKSDLVLFDVYTKEANLDEAFTEIIFEQDASVETKYSVKADKLLSVTGRGYDFIAGAYNSDGALIDVRISTVTPVKGVGAALSASVDFADSDCKNDISYVRTMLWDTKNIRPIVASQVLPPESLISAGKASKQVQFGSGKTDGTNFAWKTAPYSENKNTIFTDGDTSTVAGWGPSTISGFAFVDLGTAQKIDKVTGYAQYERGTDGSGREIYLSNINPNPTIEEAMALTGKTDAAEAVEAYYGLFTSSNSDLCYVGNLKSLTSTGEFSFNVANAGSYRYVVVKYEFGKRSGELNELRAYRKN